MDYYTFYNHLIYEGVFKKENLISAEEFYLSDHYQRFKDSIYGKLLNNTLSFNALGMHRMNSSDVFLIEVTDEDHNKSGIIDVGANTVIPIKFSRIEAVKIGGGTAFIAVKEHEDDEASYSLYINNTLIVEDAYFIESAFSEGFDYDLDNENDFVRDISFSLGKRVKECAEILIKKRIPLNEKIKALLSDADENEMLYSDKCSLSDNAICSAKKSLEKGLDYVDIGLVISPDLFKNGNKRFQKLYFQESQMFPGFFNNDVFLKGDQ